MIDGTSKTVMLAEILTRDLEQDVRGAGRRLGRVQVSSLTTCTAIIRRRTGRL